MLPTSRSQSKKRVKTSLIVKQVCMYIMFYAVSNSLSIFFYHRIHTDWQCKWGTRRFLHVWLLMLATNNIPKEFDTKGKCTQKNISTVSAILMSVHTYTFKCLLICTKIVNTSHCHHTYTSVVHFCPANLCLSSGGMICAKLYFRCSFNRCSFRCSEWV